MKRPPALASLSVLLFLSWTSVPAQQADAQEPKTLSECQARLEKWEAWSARNYPKCEKCLEGQEELRKTANEWAAQSSFLKEQNDSLKEARGKLALAFSGFGAGIFGLFAILKLLKRVWPLSPQGKQLFVLLLGATWITVAAAIGLLSERLSEHPVNLVLTVGVYSLPAVLFGGVTLWWLKRAS